MTLAPTKAYELVYQAVGKIILEYAGVETAITHVAAVLFEHAGGKSKKWKRFPHDMGGRKAFLDESFRDLPQLSPYALKWRSIQKKLERPTEVRHGLVHGVWSHQFVGPDLSMVFYRIAPHGDARMEEMRTSVDELVALGPALDKLARRAVKFSDGIDQAFTPKDHSK